VQGEHLERAESRKAAYCEISVFFDFSYGYGRKIQTCCILRIWAVCVFAYSRFSHPRKIEAKLQPQRRADWKPAPFSIGFPLASSLASTRRHASRTNRRAVVVGDARRRCRGTPAAHRPHRPPRRQRPRSLTTDATTFASSPSQRQQCEPRRCRARLALPRGCSRRRQRHHRGHQVRSSLVRASRISHAPPCVTVCVCLCSKAASVHSHL